VIFIHITSLDDRVMVVRADEIAFMAAHPAPRYYDADSKQMVDGKPWTDIVLKSGERGKCLETIDQILEMIGESV
jgi:hypothetical protein